MLAAWIQSKFCCLGSCEGLAAEFDQGSVQNPATSLSKALYHLLPTLLFCVFWLLLSSRPIENPEQKMDLGNLSAALVSAYLPAAQTNHSPFSSQGLVTEVHRVVQLHRLGWFLQESDGPLQQEPRKNSASPLCSAGHQKQTSMEEQLTVLQWNSLCHSVLMHSYSKTQGRVLWWWEAVKKILLKNSIWQSVLEHKRQC